MLSLSAPMHADCMQLLWQYDGTPPLLNLHDLQRMRRKFLKPSAEVRRCQFKQQFRMLVSADACMPRLLV
jgi:hypothetical protein